MVAPGSGGGSRPMVCPASCVTVFCTSMRTQPVSPGEVQGRLVTVVKVKRLPFEAGESFSSMSVSKISPVERLVVVVVVAITPSPFSQQSYLFPQPPVVRQLSLAGTTWEHDRLRNRTRLWLVPVSTNPTKRSDAEVESGSSGKVRSLQVIPL